MPIKVAIDEKNSLIYREFIGLVEVDEITASIESVVNHPNFHPNMKSLNDLRQVTHQADKTYVMKIAQAITQYSGKLASGKVAVVASADVVFGMMRMLQSYVGDVPIDIMIFKDVDEAMDWLEL